MRKTNWTIGPGTGRAGLRAMVLLLVGSLLILQAPGSGRAEITINIGSPTIEPLPIAIPGFAGDAQTGEQIAALVRADLVRSGFFASLDPASFASATPIRENAPDYAKWRGVGADALVAGRISLDADGQLTARFRLYDVLAGKQLAGRQYSASPQHWRRIAHLIADAIHKALTGEDGYFDSRIAFIAETGPKDRRVKRLAVMDYDGANVHYLTNGADLVLTPRFSPDAREIAYMSFDAGNPRVFLLDVETGGRRPLGNFPGMTFSPRFSPEGRHIVMSLQQEGNANIFRLDLRDRSTVWLTRAAAIDTAPSFSPDGARLVFESDRGGSQQLYVMDATGAGGGARRISRGPGRYSTPVWSPRGDLIAFTKRLGGEFHIGIMRPDGSDEKILSSGFHNEGPTWSPNGRALMFFRDIPGEAGGPQLWLVNTIGGGEQRIPTATFASDPSWSGLLQ